MLHHKSNTHLFKMDLKRCCTHTLFSALQYYIMAVTKMDSLCSLMLQDLKLYFISSKSSSHQCCQSCVPVQVYNCYSNFYQHQTESMKCLRILNNREKQPCLAECCSSIETVTMYRAQASEWEAIGL